MIRTVGAPAIICLIIFSVLLSISKQNSFHFSSHDFIIVAKPSLVLTLFVMVYFITMTIFIGSSKPSVESFDYSFSSLAPPAFSTDGDQRCNNCDDDSSHGSCEYDVDNDDDANDTEGKDSEDDEEYDNKLEKKIEGFIAKVYQKRREEFLGDRLLCITAG
ncbi:hypothetical protein SADUNF_Sadunf02G0124200 [Salix dunnii]|uniref:Uncharacterized protein n=1 Tax=Salix dunnii TaxID=1413687 RepID=A0A835TJX2_9ROSI|nr:hypothetical protein SADUNF_Sadunf02G0124200 [Salix dunnii]